jgi:hypothetical protein
MGFEVKGNIRGKRPATFLCRFPSPITSPADIEFDSSLRLSCTRSHLPRECLERRELLLCDSATHFSWQTMSGDHVTPSANRT